MSKKAYLAIDMGAESGRAIVGLLDGDQLTLEEVHRFLHLPVRSPTGLHWDLTGIWHNVIEGTHKAVEWAHGIGLSISSIGVDTWGVDFGVLGASGELLGLPRCYRDARNDPAEKKMLDALGHKYLYDQTGIQFMSLNTLPQVVAWNEDEPEVLQQAESLLFMPDLLNYFFTGQRAVESSVASTSQMIDPRTGAWSLEVMKKLDLPTKMLGRIVPTGTVVGTLLPHVATEVGAREDLQVVATASHDTAAAVAAVPADSSTNWCYLSSGTWSLMGAELDAPCTTDAAREAPFTNEGGVGGTIRFLKNICGLWLVQECRRQYEKQGDVYDYSQLTALATDAEPLTTLINPDHGPFSSPGQMPEKIAAFARETGQPEPKDVGATVRCCLESLALTYRHVLNKLEDVLDRKYDVLHIVGGGGKNRLLNQMTANAIGRRVVVGPEEATAAGNLLVQALATGDVKDLDQLRQVVKASFEPTTYEPENTEAWDEAYQRYIQFLD